MFDFEHLQTENFKSNRPSVIFIESVAELYNVNSKTPEIIFSPRSSLVISIFSDF